MNKIECLLSEFGSRLKERDLAEVFHLDDCLPTHPGIYVGNDVHGFYRGIWNPTRVLYVKGSDKGCTADKVGISAKLVDDNYRFLVADELAEAWLRTGGFGVNQEGLDKAMSILEGVPSSHVLEMIKLPYNAEIVEWEIMERIPPQSFR